MSRGAYSNNEGGEPPAASLGEGEGEGFGDGFGEGFGEGVGDLVAVASAFVRIVIPFSFSATAFRALALLILFRFVVVSLCFGNTIS